MIVPSLGFLLFALISATIYNLSPSLMWRQLGLLAANLAFLSSFSHDPLAFAPLAGFICMGFLTQRFSRVMNTALHFALIVLLIIATFIWLKRYSFVPGPLILPYPYVVLGLSYIFFRVLHVTIDRHQGALPGPIPALSYLNYMLNFPTLISGPIQRYEDFRCMESGRLRLNLPIIGRAVERIIFGYFKVVIISAALLQLQHQAMSALPASPDLAARILNTVQIIGLYPLYLYFNFSGYTDVVIGVARFFRIELPENFERPFLAENALTFWNRWHMTLSGWLKTYVFNPLMANGMSRMTAPWLAPYISVGAFFCTFFLVGVWHGQTTAFIVFGLLTGGGVAANKLWQVLLQQRLGRKTYRALAAQAMYRAICRGLNFTWFAFTLLWFWSNGPTQAVSGQAFGIIGICLTGLALFSVATVGLALLSVASQAVSALGPKGQMVVHSRYLRTAFATSLALSSVAIVAIARSPAPDIVYKAF